MISPAFLYHPHVAEIIAMGSWALAPDSNQRAILFKTTCLLFERLGVRGRFDIFPAQIYDNDGAFYPNKMHEFLPHMIESLSPVEHIMFNSTAYWPTAWTLRGSKWAPLEYMREDLMGRLVPPDWKNFFLDKVKTHFESYPSTLTQGIILRQGAATAVSERGVYGAFPDLQLFFDTLSPEYYDTSPNATQIKGSLSLFEVRAAIREKERMRKHREALRQDQRRRARRDSVEA